MKKSIKNLAFTMILFALCLVMTLSVSAEVSGDYEYTVLDDGTISITGYTGSEANLVIPSEIDGMDVTKIGNLAFRENLTLESVVIPDSITIIGKHAFNDCQNLHDVTIGENVKYIGAGAFIYCKKLESITIPDSVEDMGAYVFADCTSLTEISLSENLMKIKTKSFYRCESLKAIVIPDKVERIGKNAFYECNSLESAHIGKSVKTIEDNAFYSCENITSIEIPDSVESIGSYAFYTCSGLDSITIPDSVKYIGYSAFADTAYYVFENVDNFVLNIDNHLIRAVTDGIIGDYEIRESTVTIAEKAFAYCEQLESVKIPETVTEISQKAFWGCEQLKSVEIPETVTEIRDETFRNCGFESIEIPGSVTNIGDKVFADCENLTSVVIPDSVTSIGDGAFRDCTNLSLIEIPDSVTTVGENILADTAYYNDASNWENGILYLDGWVLSVDKELTGDCVIKEGTKGIADYAFEGCDYITSITFPKSLESIGYLSVYACDSLNSFYVDEDNKYFSVEDGILYNKDKTKLVYYPSGRTDTYYICREGLREIGDGAFSDDDVELIIVNEGVEYIGDYALYAETVYLPGNLNRVGHRFFIGAVFFNGTVEEMADFMFINFFAEGEYEVDELDAETEYDLVSNEFFVEAGIFCKSEYIPAKEAGTCLEPGNTMGIYIGAVDIWYIESEVIEGKHIDNDSDRICDLCGEPAYKVISSGPCGENCTYTLYEDGFLEVEGTGVIEGLAEALMDKNEYYMYVTSAIIHEGITGIGDFAFAELQRMKTVKIPDSVTSIGEYAFTYCYALSDLTIPQSVESIGNLAFGVCISLGNVDFYPIDAEIGIAAFGYSDMDIDESKISIEEFWEMYDRFFEYYINGEEDLAFELIDRLQECVIWSDEEPLIIGRTVINCHPDSTAQSYAEEYGVNYSLYPVSETIITESTCAKAGLKVVECECGMCEKTEVEIAVDSNNHIGETYTEGAVEATCTSAGYTGDIRCSDCGALLEEGREIPVSENHNDSDYDGYCDACNKLVADIENCDCVCHEKNNIFSIFYKFFKLLDKFLNISLVEKVFGIGKICSCGIAH